MGPIRRRLRKGKGMKEDLKRSSNVFQKYFAESPSGKTSGKRSGEVVNGRVRDFTSQLSSLPGPKNFNQRPEKTQNFLASKVSDANKFALSSYYQQVSVRNETITYNRARM